jgi:hypothetical protein
LERCSVYISSSNTASLPTSHKPSNKQSNVGTIGQSTTVPLKANPAGVLRGFQVSHQFKTQHSAAFAISTHINNCAYTTARPIPSIINLYHWFSLPHATDRRAKIQPFSFPPSIRLELTKKPTQALWRPWRKACLPNQAFLARASLLGFHAADGYHSPSATMSTRRGHSGKGGACQPILSLLHALQNLRRRK